MTNTKLSMITACTALAGLATLAAPASAKAQCHRPVYAPVTYVDYAPAVVPARPVFVSQPVYVPRTVYVDQPVYVAPRFRSRGFNLNLSFGNNNFRGSYGHHRNFRNDRGFRSNRFRSRGHHSRRSRGFRRSFRR